MAISTEVKGSILHITVGSRHLSTDVDKWHAANQHTAKMWGVKERLTNLVAAPAPEQEKADRIQAAIEHYESGSPEWRIGAAMSGGDAVRAVMAAYNVDLTAARDKIEANAKRLGISEATMRTRLITLPGPVRDAYVAMLEERGIGAKGDVLLGDFS